MNKRLTFVGLFAMLGVSVFVLATTLTIAFSQSIPEDPPKKKRKMKKDTTNVVQQRNIVLDEQLIRLDSILNAVGADTLKKK